MNMLDEPPLIDYKEDSLPLSEPQVTSMDPNERKLARRLRIERRVEAMRRQNAPEGEEEVEEVTQKTMVEKQLDKSSNTIDKLLTEAYEQISNIRVANESREVDRREQESIDREKLIEALEEEAKQAQDMFEDIAGKWAEILRHHDPLQIHEDMESQKEKCEALLRQKDGIIAMLREEIKMAEKKFTTDQKKQNEDITTLTERIERQIKQMRRVYKQELKCIDDVILEERKILIDMNNRKWEELYKKRDAEEKQQAEKKFEQQEEFVKEMDELRKVYQEQYRETKIKLEREVEDLQQEFEIIKTAAVTNEEKLDYNYQILRKREDENLILNSQQKRRINKLQDIANMLRKKNQDYDEHTQVEITRLTKEVKKLQKCVVEIETKAVSLSKINDLKFKQVWELNVSNANKLVNRIMMIDKILHEQQMGLEWKKFDSILLTKKQMGSYERAVDLLPGDSKSSADSRSTKPKGSRTVSETGSRIGESKKGADILPPKDFKVYEKLLRHILERVSERSGYLLEKRLQELLQPYVENEQNLVKVDNVFTALGIKEQENIDQMCLYFLPYARCLICAKSAPASAKGSERYPSITDAAALPDSIESSVETYVEPVYERMQRTVNQPADVVSDIVHDLVDTGEGTESSLSANTTTTADECMPPVVESEHGEIQNIVAGSKKSLHTVKFACRFNHPLHVSPVFVIKALREFLAVFFKDVSGTESIATRLSQKHETQSRLMSQDDVKQFWQRYKTFFNTSRMRLWDGLYIGLQKYYEILKDRRKLNDEVLCLRKQNLELQQLLSIYKNYGPMVPPPCAEQRELPIIPTYPKSCKK